MLHAFKLALTLATLLMSAVRDVLSSTALLNPSELLWTQAYGFFYGVSLILKSSSFPAASRFPSITIFSEEPCPLMMRLEKDSFSFVVFASSDVSGFVCSRIHFFIFLNMDQGTHRALL